MTTKKAIFMIALICLLPLITADFITDYYATPSVPLNQELIITGKFYDDLNLSNNQICSYYITNVDGNETIYRISDSYTDVKGVFYQKLKITEPRFKRGEDYNALTRCQLTEASQTFTVAQRETVYEPLLWEFKWMTDEGNVNPIVWMIGLPLLAILVGLGAWNLLKRYRGGL